MDWLMAYLLEETYRKSEELRAKGQTSFEVRNNQQVFYAATLSKVYGERTILYRVCEFINKMERSPERDVVTKVGIFYGQNMVLKYLAYFYEVIKLLFNILLLELTNVVCL